MAEPKTKPTDASVEEFLNSVQDKNRREDAFKLLNIFSEVTGLKPKMWGTSIIGYGQYHYVYASGKEGDWPITAFSPRKQNLTVYIMPGFEDFTAQLAKLGKYKSSVSCLYINKLSDINESVLREVIKLGVEKMRKSYPTKD